MHRFTVAIPGDLLAEAKRVAAKDGTSVNSLVRRLLEGHVQHSQVAAPGNYEILFKYSLGRVTARAVQRELHLDSDEALRAMVVNAGLPLPRLSERETKQMQGRLGGMIDRTLAEGALRRYSRGELPERDAMSAMALRTREDLYAAVVSAGLELPRGDPVEIERQASVAAQMIQGARLTVTATELRRHFDFIIDVVLPTEEVIHVTRRGRVQCVIVSPEIFDRMGLCARG